MIQKILSIYENEKKKKKRYKSILPIPCQQKNEFNEDDDWFDRAYRTSYTCSKKGKIEFSFFEIDIIRHTEVKNLDHQGQRSHFLTTWNCSFLPILFSEKAHVS